MKKRIVIVEDEKDIVESLKYMIEKHGFEVVTHESAESLFTNFQTGYCTYLIDWNLPGIKGPDIVRTIRTKDKISPVFMISANSSSEHIIEGLKTGADDYIVKPFSYDALMVKLLNAHSKVSNLHENLINVGLKLIPEANTLIKDGITVNLTAREFIIFQHLYNQSSVVSTREELITQFDKAFEMTARNIDVHVFSLRKKVSKVSIVIETVWGTGYKLNL